MNREWATAAVVAFGALALGVGIGRASKPAEVQTKVEYQDRIEYKDRVVTKVVYREKRDQRKHVETHTESRPDGSSVVVRVEDSHAVSDGRGAWGRDRAGAGAGSTTTTSSSSVRDRATWRASLSADWGTLQLRPELFGGSVERRIAGPLWLGVHGRTDRTFGVSLGFEFH